MYSVPTNKPKQLYPLPIRLALLIIWLIVLYGGSTLVYGPPYRINDQVAAIETITSYRRWLGLWNRFMTAFVVVGGLFIVASFLRVKPAIMTALLVVFSLTIIGFVYFLSTVPVFVIS